jgi:hypothetical protein
MYQLLGRALNRQQPVGNPLQTFDITGWVDDADEHRSGRREQLVNANDLGNLHAVIERSAVRR